MVEQTEIEQLKQENEALRDRVADLSFVHKKRFLIPLGVVLAAAVIFEVWSNITCQEVYFDANNEIAINFWLAAGWATNFFVIGVYVGLVLSARFKKAAW